MSGVGCRAEWCDAGKVCLGTGECALPGAGCSTCAAVLRASIARAKSFSLRSTSKTRRVTLRQPHGPLARAVDGTNETLRYLTYNSTSIVRALVDDGTTDGTTAFTDGKHFIGKDHSVAHKRFVTKSGARWDHSVIAGDANVRVGFFNKQPPVGARKLHRQVVACARQHGQRSAGSVALGTRRNPYWAHTKAPCSKTR